MYLRPFLFEEFLLANESVFIDPHIGHALLQQSYRSPGGKTRFLPLALPDLPCILWIAIGLLYLLLDYPDASALQIKSFALRFLQIPPHGGHPCFRRAAPAVPACSGLAPYEIAPCPAHEKGEASV